MRNPKGYWDDFENIEALLIPICKELGYMPSSKDIEKRGLHSLSRIGISKHGGMKNVAIKLGYQTYDEFVGRNSANYWTLENTVNEFVEFVSKEKLSYFPSKKEFIALKKINLLNAIYKIGLQEFKKNKIITELNFPKKTKNYLWNEEKIVKQLQKVISDIGFFPSSKKLDDLGLADLRGAISTNGGSQYYWKVLGEPKHESRKQKDRVDSNNLDYIENEYLKLCEKLGHTATTNDITRLDMHWLNLSIRNKFGSIKNLILKHNLATESLSLIRTNDGHLVRSINEAIFDNILYILDIQHETEGLIPCQIKRRYQFDFRVKNLVGEEVFVEIWGYEDNGYPNAKTDLYLKNKEKKKLLYQENKLNLLEIDGSFFNSPINKIFDYVQAKLIGKNIISQQFQFDDNHIEAIIYTPYKIQDLVNEYDSVSISLGHYPSARDLIKANKSELIDRISKLGGFKEMQKYSKVNLQSKPFRHKWTEDILLNELKILIKDHGKVPTPSQLKKMNRLDIFGALNKFGGIRKFAKKYNLETSYKTYPSNFTDIFSIGEALKSLLTVDNKIPTLAVIQTHGSSGLYRAIIKYGGIVKVAIELDLELDYPKYNDIEYTKHVANLVIRKYGFIPSSKVLMVSYGSFVQAVNRSYGGLAEIANIMNSKHLKQKLL